MFKNRSDQRGDEYKKQANAALAKMVRLLQTTKIALHLPIWLVGNIRKAGKVRSSKYPIHIVNLCTDAPSLAIDPHLHQATIAVAIYYFYHVSPFL